MNLEFGKSIMTSDGAQAGTVDQFVIDPQTHDLVAIISREGFIFTEDRVIESGHIDHVDDDGTVHLNQPEDTVDELPTVASARFVYPDESDQYESFDRDAFVRATRAGGVMVAPAGTYSAITGASTPFFGVADADPPPIHDASNISEGDVTINEGTDVVDSNGKKIGEVDEVVFAGDEVEAVIVKAGFIFHHKIRVPSEWITSVTQETVQLNRVADDVEREGRINE